MHHGSYFGGDPFNNGAMNPAGFPGIDPYFGMQLVPQDPMQHQQQHQMQHQQQQHQMQHHHQMAAHPFNALTPFGGAFGHPFGDLFGGMNQMMAQMQHQMSAMQHQMHADPMQAPAGGPGCQFYSSSSFVSYDGSQGQPHVYEAHSSTRSGPDGVRETRKAVKDSRSGEEKMSVGHHIHDRAFIHERRRNRITNEEEEQEDLIGMDHEELPEFRREWEQRAPRHHPNAIGMRQRLGERRALTDGRREHRM